MQTKGPFWTTTAQIGMCARHATSKNCNKISATISSLHVGLTIILGLTPLRVSPELRTNAVIESCQQIATCLWKEALQIRHHNLFQTACQITGCITAPLLCATMLITSIEGKTHLHQHFQVDSPMPCDTHCKNEQHTTRKTVCANGQLRQKFCHHRQH